MSRDLIFVENTPMQETWEAMEALVDNGKAKNIGIRYPPIVFLPSN